MRKLLYFHAPWCPPCRFYEQEFIEKIEKAVGEDKVQRINAQDEPFVAEKHLVDKLPYVILLDGENVYMRRTGAIDIKHISKWLKGGS